MEINLREYLLVIKKRLWLVIVWVLLFTTLTAIYSSLNYRPIYMASTKLIVNKTSEKDSMGKEQIDFGAIGVNIALINTYKEIIKTPAIMDKVLQRYPDLNVSAEQLIAITNVSDLNETQVMTIVVQYYSQEKAVRIANAVSEVFQSEIPKIMKVDNITILNRAKVQDNPIPINKKSNQYIVLGFLGSLVTAIGFILFLDAMDDTLKKEADIRHIFEASVVGSIPRMKEKELKLDKRKIANRKGVEAAYAKTVRE